MNKSKSVSHYGNHHLATWLNSVLFVLLQCNKLPQAQLLRTTNFHNRTASVGPESVSGFPRFSGLSHPFANQGVGRSFGLPSRLTRERSVSRLTCLLPEFSSLPGGPLQRAAHHVAA